TLSPAAPAAPAAAGGRVRFSVGLESEIDMRRGPAQKPTEKKRAVKSRSTIVRATIVRTTVRVVAEPTPWAPPVTPRPSQQARPLMMAPKTNALIRPVPKSFIVIESIVREM